MRLEALASRQGQARRNDLRQRFATYETCLLSTSTEKALGRSRGFFWVVDTLKIPAFV